MRLLGPQLVKLAFQAATAAMKAQVKAQDHFSSSKPDWRAFVRNLKGVNFRQAIMEAAEADPKLKKYVKNFGGYLASKDELASIKSKDSGKTYRIKDLHNGRWGCNCGDWQYVHSVQGGDCKHIKSVKQSKMVKKASLRLVTVPFTQTTRALRQRDKGLAAKKTVKHLQA